MTDYAKIITPKREVLVPMAISNFGAPYKELFDKAIASGYEAWLAYSHNNFDNPFQKADEALYKKMGWFAEILRDKVLPCNVKKGEVTYGRLPLVYVANAGTEHEQEINVLAPETGWYVPTKDGVFVPGTLIPFETVGDKDEAIKRLEASGVPKEQVSFFYRLDNYDSERFVGRHFDSEWDGYGRFGVDASRLPNYSGHDFVGCRSRR